VHAGGGQGWKSAPVQGTQKIEETGNVLSAIESQGFRKKRASAPDYLKLIQILREMNWGLNDTSSRKPRLGVAKGQPEGSAVTGKTRKPWAVNPLKDVEPKTAT
jgi:hypothetical protein